MGDRGDKHTGCQYRSQKGAHDLLESARNIPQEVLSALGFGDKQRKTNSFQERTEGRGAGEGQTVYNVGEGDRDQKPEEAEDSSSKSSKLGDRESGRGMCKEGGVRVPASSGSGTRFLQRVVQAPLLGDSGHTTGPLLVRHALH